MSYIKTGAAHTNQLTEDLYGNEQTRYSRYETGLIEGEYRDMLALIADETGFDGLGFDVNAGSNDDSWHVVNLFENGGHYVDAVAIGGALDEEHALTLATTQFDYLGADYGVLVGYAEGMQFDHMTDDGAWSIDAISKLLNNPSQDKHYLPIITSKELQEEATRAAFNDVQWDNLTLSSHGGSLTNLYTDMIRADTFKELTQEFDLQQALIDLEAEEAEFDSIMDTVNRLPMLKDRLFRAMSQASNETLSVTNVTQTKPFKRGGVVNVAFVFDLSDGQKLSIWFHNPDSTPSKLLAGDMMVSWKWLLNKRDVTAILSPINGQDVKIPTLARQMMLLASKNSKNFKRAQERKAKRDADINEAQINIEKKKQTIEQLDNDIASLKDQIDAAMKANKGKADKDTTETTNDDSSQDMNIQVNSIDIDSLDIEPRYKKRLLDGVQRGLGILDTAAQTKLKQNIESLKTQLTSMGVSFISEGEYQEKINSNEEPGFSVQSLQDDLKESVSQLHKLVNKQIRPSKIVGTGYKDNRAVAFENLGLNIAENEVVLRTQPSGFYKTVNLSNYETYLDVLVSSSKKANEGVTTASQIEPKEVPKSDVKTFSPENPYARYANDDEDAMANAERWEARKVLTEKGLEKLNELAESFGFTTFIEPRHAGLGVFQAVKEVSNRRVEIEGKFKNYDGESAKESPNDFTIEWSQDGEVVDYQYTNDLPEYIEKANNWLNQDDDDTKQLDQEAMASVSEIIRSDKTNEKKAELILEKIKHIYSVIDDKNIKVDKNAVYYKEARRESENYGGLEPNFWVRYGKKKPSEVMEYGAALAEAHGGLVFVQNKGKELSKTIRAIKGFSNGKPGYKGVASYPSDGYEKVKDLEPGDWVALPTAIDTSEITIYFKSPFGDVETVVANGFEPVYKDMREKFFKLLDQKELEDEKNKAKDNIKETFGKTIDELFDEYYASTKSNIEKAKKSGNSDLQAQYNKELRKKRNNIWDVEDYLTKYASNDISAEQLLNSPAGEIATVQQLLATNNEGTPMSETSTAYSQDDIDYLNSIIDGSLSTDDIDLDRLTVIGEKDEHNPLFTQALDVVLSAVDKESSDL